MKRFIKVCGKEILISGRLLRIAQLEGDSYEFIEDPEPMLNGLRKCGVQIDLFTFIQKLSETLPKYKFPIEWDNFAAVPVFTFEDWCNHQIRPEARNRARQAGSAPPARRLLLLAGAARTSRPSATELLSWLASSSSNWSYIPSARKNIGTSREGTFPVTSKMCLDRIPFGHCWRERPGKCAGP